jgi:hypothetical protein
MDSSLEKDNKSAQIPASPHHDTPTTPTKTTSRTTLFVSLASLVCLIGLFLAKMTGSDKAPTPGSNDIVTQPVGEDVDTIGNFRLTQKIKLNYTDVVITKWQSQQTGLRVVHVDYEGTRL